MMKNPSCANHALKAWKGQVMRLGLAIDATGESCRACNDIVLDQKEMERVDAELAAGLVARGIREGQEFRLVRKAAGLKSTELAELLDVRPETITRWEKGEQEIPRPIAFALGELYDRPRVTREKLEAFTAKAAR